MRHASMTSSASTSKTPIAYGSSSGSLRRRRTRVQSPTSVHRPRSPPTSSAYRRSPRSRPRRDRWRTTAPDTPERPRFRRRSPRRSRRRRRVAGPHSTRPPQLALERPIEFHIARRFLVTSLRVLGDDGHSVAKRVRRRVRRRADDFSPRFLSEHLFANVARNDVAPPPRASDRARSISVRVVDSANGFKRLSAASGPSSVFSFVSSSRRPARATTRDARRRARDDDEDEDDDEDVARESVRSVDMRDGRRNDDDARAFIRVILSIPSRVRARARSSLDARLDARWRCSNSPRVETITDSP